MSHGSANESILSFTIFIASISPWKTIILISLFCSLSLEEFTEWQEIASLLEQALGEFPCPQPRCSSMSAAFLRIAGLVKQDCAPSLRKGVTGNVVTTYVKSLRPLSLIFSVRLPKVTSLKTTDIRPVVVLEIHIYKDQELPIRALVQHTTFTQVLQAGTKASKQLTCSAQVSGGPVLLHHIRACELSPAHWTPLFTDTYSTKTTTAPCLQIYPFLTEGSQPKLLLPVQEELVNAESMVSGQCAAENKPTKGPSNLHWTCCWFTLFAPSYDKR